MCNCVLFVKRTGVFRWIITSFDRAISFSRFFFIKIVADLFFFDIRTPATLSCRCSEYKYVMRIRSLSPGISYAREEPAAEISSIFRCNFVNKSRSGCTLSPLRLFCSSLM